MPNEHEFSNSSPHTKHAVKNVIDKNTFSKMSQNWLYLFAEN